MSLLGSKFGSRESGNLDPRCNRDDQPPTREMGPWVRLTVWTKEWVPCTHERKLKWSTASSSCISDETRSLEVLDGQDRPSQPGHQKKSLQYPPTLSLC